MPGQRLIRRMATALEVPTDVVFAACQESARQAKGEKASAANAG